MKKESKTKYIVLGIVGFIVAAVLIGGMLMWSHRQHAVALEQKIESQYAANKSNYDNMWKKFKEMTQVTDMQAKHYKDVYQGLIQGRNQDTQLLFKMIKEDNPKLDGKVYTELQREIASGRQTFDNNQKKIADIIREYNTYVEQKIFMKAITGRQPKDVNKYITTSDDTNKAFETGKSDEIKLGE